MQHCPFQMQLLQVWVHCYDMMTFPMIFQQVSVVWEKRWSMVLDGSSSILLAIRCGCTMGPVSPVSSKLLLRLLYSIDIHTDMQMHMLWKVKLGTAAVECLVQERLPAFKAPCVGDGEHWTTSRADLCNLDRNDGSLSSLERINYYML